MCTNCQTTMTLCSNQDLREPRVRSGETKFVGKNIVKCQECCTNLSSDDVAMNKLDSIFSNISPRAGHAPEKDSLFLNHTFEWSTSQKKSKYQVCMEIELIQEYIKEMKGKNSI